MWSQWNGRTHSESLRFGQDVRRYLVYRPAKLERRPALVINLQAAGGNGSVQEGFTRFDAQADRLGWLVAYPDAAAHGWTAFGCCKHAGVDDMTFIAKMIDHLQATDGVDPNRVYVTGWSRGGMMSYRVACELSSQVAAIAAVSGNMADASGNAYGPACSPARPVSVLAINGRADPEVPIDGGRSRVTKEDVVYSPMRDVLERWRQLDGCASFETTSVSGPVTVASWACRQGSGVTSVVIDGAGHSWPGAPLVNPPGASSASVDGSRLIADFFASHRRGAMHG